MYYLVIFFINVFFFNNMPNIVKDQFEFVKIEAVKSFYSIQYILNKIIL